MPGTPGRLLIPGSRVSGVGAASPEAIASGEPKTGITLPGNGGPLKYQGVKHHDNPAWGVCIRWAGEGLIKADRFIYDLGREKLRTGLHTAGNALCQAKGKDIVILGKMRVETLDQVSGKSAAAGGAITKSRITLE